MDDPAIHRELGEISATLRQLIKEVQGVNTKIDKMEQTFNQDFKSLEERVDNLEKSSAVSKWQMGAIITVATTAITSVITFGVRNLLGG